MNDLHLENDESLFRKIAQGDEASFRILFDRFKSRCYSSAIKMTRSVDLAEEIVQDTFVSLWTSRAVLNKVQNPSGYLFTILYNQIYAQFKKLSAERLMKANLTRLPEADESSVEEYYNEKETSQYIQKLIRQLPHRQQQIFILSKQEGMSRKEIAQKLQLSPHTVKNHLLEAVKFVRANFYKAFMLFILNFFGQF